MKKIKEKVKKNKKVILYSVIGLMCVALGFLVSWVFMIGAAIFIYLNQKELMRKK
jgi:hypothetical protein